MKLAGEEPETLDAILISHEHSDHVGGVAVTARKLKIPVYFTEGTHRAWMRWLSPRRQMSYAQWLEQIRKQTAERQAEADTAAEEGEPDESDLVEAEDETVLGKASEEQTSGAKAPDDNEAITARLKSCPDTMRNLKHSLQAEHLQQFFHRKPVMSGDSLEDAGEGSGFDRLMRGNDFVVLAAALCGHANMRSLLTCDLIA
jgi:ribonuclease BN (tRNA processing enzyme)